MSDKSETAPPMIGPDRKMPGMTQGAFGAFIILLVSGVAGYVLLQSRVTRHSEQFIEYDMKLNSIEGKLDTQTKALIELSAYLKARDQMNGRE